MSRRAMLMSLSACVMEDGFQLANQTSAVDERTSDQPHPPTITASQHEAAMLGVTQDSSSELTARDKRRKAYFYNRIDPNNKNRTQPNNVRSARRVPRGSHEQYTQSNRLSGNARGNLQGRTAHTQSPFSTDHPPVPSGGALYTGPIAQITNIHNHYHITPEQVGLGSTQTLGLNHAPPQIQRVVPSQLPSSRPIPAAIALPLVAHGAHGQAGGLQGRPQQQAQAQQQGLNFSPRLSATSGHSNFSLVGVAIAPPSSVSAEPRAITRTRTMPAQTTLELSRSY